MVLGLGKKESKLAVPEMERLVVPELRQGRYLRKGGEIEYSQGLARDERGNVIVNVNRDNARELARAAELRLSTAAEEHVLSGGGYKDAAFNDNFARNPEGGYYWNWIDTDLLKPKGRKSDYRKAKNGRQYWLRIVAEGGEPVGELWAPEGGGNIIKEWSPFGLPAETANESHTGSETHFYFDSNLEEAAVLRGRSWYVAHAVCFSLSASYAPSCSGPSGGFRLVRGSRPSYEKIVAAPRKAL